MVSITFSTLFLDILELCTDLSTDFVDINNREIRPIA